MKIAFYVEDSRQQIVLTPSNDFEKRMLAKLHDHSIEFSIKRGNFYDCQGGWLRHGSISQGPYGVGDHDDSTIILLHEKKS